MTGLSSSSFVSIDLTSSPPHPSLSPRPAGASAKMDPSTDGAPPSRPWMADFGFVFEYPAPSAATTTTTTATYHQQQQHRVNAVEPGPPRKRVRTLDTRAVVIDLTVEEDEEDVGGKQGSSTGNQILNISTPASREIASSSSFSTASSNTLKRTPSSSSSDDNDEITITAECSACLDQKPLSTLLRLPCTAHYLCHENAAPGSCLELSIKASLSTRTLFACCTHPLPASHLTLPPSSNNFFPTPLLPADATTAYTLLHEEFTTDSPLFCHNTHCRVFIPSSSIPPRGRALASCPKCSKQTCQFCRRRPGRGHNWAECRSGASGRVSRKGKVKGTLGKRKREEGEVMEELDEGMQALMKAKGWKRCPWWDKGCGAMVEKKNGCDHVRCRCGKEMCYRCGKKYHECKGRCAREVPTTLPGVAEVVGNIAVGWPHGSAHAILPPWTAATAYIPPVSTDPLNNAVGEQFWASPENQRFVRELPGLPTAQRLPALPVSTVGMNPFSEAFVGFDQDPWGRTLDVGGVAPFDVGDMAFFDFAQQVWGA